GREFNDSFSHQKVRTIDDYRRRLDRLSLKITTCRPVFTLFNAPYDLSIREHPVVGTLLKSAWWFNSNLFLLFERLGRPGILAARACAPALYAIDRLLTDRTDLEVTTKLCVIRPFEQAGDAV
ncbi:MAG: hypothetical protein ACYC99_14365, partial [Candidatus Geothermincolia bacterium]